MPDLNKADIRQLAKALGLPNWDKPAAPCLATRFPYNTQLTREEIEQVGKAESYLHLLGFRTARVRYEDNIARIEVEVAAFPNLITHSDDISRSFSQLGFKHTTLDLTGYRSGSMDEGLPEAKIINLETDS